MAYVGQHTLSSMHAALKKNELIDPLSRMSQYRTITSFIHVTIFPFSLIYIYIYMCIYVCVCVCVSFCLCHFIYMDRSVYLYSYWSIYRPLLTCHQMPIMWSCFLSFSISISYLSICLFISTFPCMLISLSLFLSTYLSVCESICVRYIYNLFIFLYSLLTYVYLFIYIYIYIYIYIIIIIIIFKCRDLGMALSFDWCWGFSYGPIGSMKSTLRWHAPISILILCIRVTSIGQIFPFVFRMSSLAAYQ